jgi:hypothetical protein
MGSPSWAYIETDIPADMTLRDFRRVVDRDRKNARRAERRFVRKARRTES